MTTINRRLIAFLLLGAMLATACGGGSSGPAEVASTNAGSDSSSSADSSAANTDADDDDEPASSESDAPADDNATSSDAETDSSATSAVEQGATSMAASSPIGAFFADDGGFETAIAEYSIKVEEQIVICMAAQGFEFARSELNTGNEVEERQNELTRREWTTEYGFGISTSFDSIAQNQAANPNAQIVFSLSEGEREIWVQTLTGGNPDAVGDTGNVPLEEQGCIGEALIATGGQDVIEGLQNFGDIYEEGEEALFERREMIEVVDAWTRCMSEGGFPGYATLDDPEEDIEDQFEVITSPIDAAIDELTEEEGQALISGESLDLDTLPGLDIDALRALQDAEKALALADLDCYEAEVQAVYEPLRDNFERGLLTEYATEFQAVKDLGS